MKAIQYNVRFIEISYRMQPAGLPSWLRRLSEIPEMPRLLHKLRGNPLMLWIF
jgi:hypothetical protein